MGVNFLILNLLIGVAVAWPLQDPLEGDQTRLQNDAQIAPAEVAPERIAMSTTESIRKAAGITKKLSSESEKDKSLTLIVNATQTSTDVRKDLRPKNEATTEHLKIQTNAEKAKDERPEAATEAPAQFFIINKDNNEEEEQSSPQKPLDPGPGTPPVTFDYMSSPPNSFRKITFNIPHFIQKPLQPSDFFPKEFGSSDFTPKPLAAPFLETEGVDDPAQTDGSENQPAVDNSVPRVLRKLAKQQSQIKDMVLQLMYRQADLRESLNRIEQKLNYNEAAQLRMMQGGGGSNDESSPIYFHATY